MMKQDEEDLASEENDMRRERHMHRLFKTIFWLLMFDEQNLGVVTFHEGSSLAPPPPPPPPAPPPASSSNTAHL